MTGPDDVAASLDGLVVSGRDPGGAVAVVRDRLVEVDHAAGTVDGERCQRDEEDQRLEIGMGGAGGCSAWTEPALGYGAAFVSRGLGGHDRGEVVWEAVRAAHPPRPQP